MHKAAGMDVRDALRDLQNEAVLLPRAQTRLLRRSLRDELGQRAVRELGNEHGVAFRVFRHAVELQTVGVVQSLLDLHLAIEVDFVALRKRLSPHLHGDFFVFVDAMREVESRPRTPCTLRRRIPGLAWCW